MVIKHGYALDITPKVHFNELPDRVRGLVGRASDWIHILKELDEQNFVWIEGPTGIGKSTLAKEVIHLAYERNIFADGVLYIHMDNVTKLILFLE